MKGVERLLDDVETIMKSNRFSISRIEYPDGGKKSIDIVASKDNEKVAIKAVSKIDKVDIEEISDLKKLSIATNTTPLVVAEEIVGDDVILEKSGINAISTEGLNRAVNGEKLFFVRKKGNIFVRINSVELKREREKLGISRGKLAEEVGVTSKSIYEYENQTIVCVAVNVAEKLVEVLGESILAGPTDYQSSEKLEVNTTSKIARQLNEMGIPTTDLRRTPVDFISKYRENTIFLTREDKEGKIFKKINESEKIAENIKGLMIVIADSQNVAEEARRKGKEVLMSSELSKIPEVINESHRNN
ncbi:hypothetical protein HS7_18630 [Sulfolobales archaeon HS-7]|nr:hypothetical protein HS7_18630 [Sulfolobales archaeon HS-7]